MAKISLKNIVGKKNEANAIITSLIDELQAKVWIEDENGKVLLGDPQESPKEQFPIQPEDEISGWVKGDDKGKIIATLITHLLQKESEKKKLGSEVLTLSSIFPKN